VRLLSCLGQEEARLYKKKEQGSLFRLNQKLINTLVNSPDLELAPNFEQSVCHASTSVAEKTLFYALLYPQEFFSVHTGVQRRQARYFISTLPSLFFTYLSQLQAEMPTAHCLERVIPEVHYYLERFKYLETELPASTLLADRKKLLTIMRRLQHKEEIYQKCSKRTLK
jgi:hypothetical protein